MRISWFSITAMIILVAGVVSGLFIGSGSYNALHPFELSRNIIYILLIIVCMNILNLERHNNREKYIWLCLAGSVTLNTIGSLIQTIFKTPGIQNQIVMMISSLIFFFAYLSLILGLILVVVLLQGQKSNKPSRINSFLLIIIFVTLFISILFTPIFKTSALPFIEKTVYAVYLGFDIIIIITSSLIFSLLSKRQTLSEKLSVYDYICFGVIILVCYHIFYFFNLFTGNQIHANFNILRIIAATLWVIGSDIKLQEVGSNSQ